MCDRRGGGPRHCDRTRLWRRSSTPQTQPNSCFCESREQAFCTRRLRITEPCWGSLEKAAQPVAIGVAHVGGILVCPVRHSALRLLVTGRSQVPNASSLSRTRVNFVNLYCASKVGIPSIRRVAPHSPAHVHRVAVMVLLSTLQLPSFPRVSRFVSCLRSPCASS